MYRVFNDLSDKPSAVLNLDTNTSFLINIEQPLYQTFKAQINADEAQLEDADGVLMSPEEAKAFVATLP